MRLHTDKLTGLDLYKIRKAVIDENLIAPHVYFDKLDGRGSRSRARAFDVHLATATKLKGDGRRWLNTGNEGAGNEYAATYDEWGWLIAEIFERDPEAIFGNYKGREDFHRQTHGAYTESEKPSQARKVIVA